MLSEEDRFEALKEYYPQAKKEDWRLWQGAARLRDAEKAWRTASGARRQ